LHGVKTGPGFTGRIQKAVSTPRFDPNAERSHRRSLIRLIAVINRSDPLCRRYRDADRTCDAVGLSLTRNARMNARTHARTTGTVAPHRAVGFQSLAA
jgi:hypothetical protein